MKHHPDTVEGRASHKAQQDEWAKTHGELAWVTESTPYPLRPGTAPVGSNECFACGMVGHTRPSCTVPKERQLRKQESQWRFICGKVLREPVQMRWVSTNEYDDVVAGDQGKEERSST